MRRILIGLVFVLTAFPAWAQVSDEEWNRCSGADSGAAIPAEARIGYCTQLIQSGRLATEGLAGTYDNRGNAYDNRGLHDQAISDYNQALALKPDDAEAYFNRGDTFEKLGRRDEAIADYRSALNYDPNDDASKRALARLGVTP
jgi:tetratricopeptide (TPR) repeat protein